MSRLCPLVAGGCGPSVSSESPAPGHWWNQTKHCTLSLCLYCLWPFALPIPIMLRQWKSFFSNSRFVAILQASDSRVSCKKNVGWCTESSQHRTQGTMVQWCLQTFCVDIMMIEMPPPFQLSGRRNKLTRKLHFNYDQECTGCRPIFLIMSLKSRL